MAQCPSMKTTWLTGCCLFLASALCYGADAGVLTILDGNARVLRGVTWYKLAEGARVQDGDLIEASDHAQVQLELASGPIVNFVGPAALFTAAAGSRQGSKPAPAELYLPGGWLKLAVKSPSTPLHVRTAFGSLSTAGAIAVLHAENDAIEIFLETGSAKLLEPGKNGGDGAAHDVQGGDFALDAADRAFATADAAPQNFVAAMPRHFRDPLPSLAAQYQVVRVQPIADRPISYAEAEPWLTGPYRRAFLKRLQPRLADAEFRAPAMAKPQAYPEWQAALVPPEAAGKDKAEPPKAPEKAESGWKWPFGDKKK
jgi:hypothetical protein